VLCFQGLTSTINFMERKPWTTKLADLFRVKPGPVSFHNIARLPAPALRSRHTDFPSKSMRRGVQVSKERKQRSGRIAWISESCRQGRVIAAELKIKRQVRAELRKVC
jgi:hypothetical protein